MATNTTGRPEKDTLPVGSSRLGFIYDGRHDSPDVACLLENDGKSIRLTVPWSGNYAREYRAWFSDGDILFDHAPHEPVPERLFFRDRLGRVALIGCRSVGFNDVIPRGDGAGRIHADYAVMGADQADRYSRICGLRSEVQGLGEWMGIRSVHRRHIVKGRVRVEVVAEPPPPQRLNSRLNATAQASFRIIRSVPDETTVRESTSIQTQVTSPREWNDHLAFHMAIRDLISISAWRAATFESHAVLHVQDPLRVLSGQTVGEKWNPVATHVTGIPAEKSAQKLNFLFKFDDLKTAGISRWLRVRENFSRGVEPIVASLNFPAGSIETSAVELCIGLEALGFQLAREQGLSKTKSDALTFAERVERVGSSVPYPLPFQIADLAKRSADVYNGLKHANRKRPDFVDTLNVWRELVVLFRFWVAARLQVPARTVKSNFELDRMQHAYVEA